MHLLLPPQINADGLLPFLSLLATAGEEREVYLDFSALRRVSPGALAALAAAVTGWLRQHRKVVFLNLDQCAITGYLQRMDVLRACGADLPESFRRHDSKGRFVPVRLVDHDVEGMGKDMAACLAPGGEEMEHPHAALYDLAWYVFTETANNARQHSRGLGYAAAQVTRSEGLVRLAIADNGKGIRQSFVDAGLPWAKGLSDGQAILKALEPKVSSKGRPTNEGVGLTLVAGLVRQARGWLLVVSGSGVVRLRAGGEPEVETLPSGGRFEGTLVVTAFRQQDVCNFAGLLHDAKVQAGLLRSGGHTGIFKA
jgi:hypothetical protein